MGTGQPTYPVNLADTDKVVDTSTGVADAGKLIKTNNEGKIDPTFSSIVFTAGETIAGATLPVAVYQDSSTGKVFACDGNDTAKLGFIGFAITTADDTEDIIVQTSGVVTGLSGLTLGGEYFVKDDKTLGTTVGTYTINVGSAITTTTLLIRQQQSKLVAPSDTIVVSADTSRSVSNNAAAGTFPADYSKKKEVTLNVIGGVRVTFTLQNSVDFGSIRAVVAVNGTQVAYIEQSVGSDGGVGFGQSVDVYDLVYGDVISLYIRGIEGSNSGTSACSAFKIKYTPVNTILTGATVTLD